MMRPDSTSVPKKAGHGGLICVALLAITLAILFYRSLNPDEVVFSNDGRYGAMVAEQNRMPAIMTGLWQDLNWLGDQYPSPSPSGSTVLRFLTSPLVFSKIFCPAAIFFLGICAWFCFRQWNLSPLACILGGLAAAFSSHFFSTAGWGVAYQLFGIGMCFVAIGVAADSSGWRFWVRLALAGLAVGLNIAEAYDIGAIFSLFVAAFVLCQSLIRESSTGKGVRRGVLQVGVVALFAAFCATHALSVLIGTQLQGATGELDGMTPQQHYDWATQWSMPKKELPRILIPGLFGYRMDTPRDMAAFQDWFQGGVYWGEVGRNPELDRYLDNYHASGKEGTPPGIPGGAWRFSGGGEYAGMLVVALALWAVAQSFRKENSVFSPAHRKFIWFWAVAAFISLLFALGRYAPFYRLFYLLPHASNIRNASKFMHPFHWAVVILFAYGVHGISQRYLSPGKALAVKPDLFDRRWIIGSFVFLGVSIVAWLAYASEHGSLEKYLMSVGFGDPDHPVFAAQVARFSLMEVGLFVLFSILTVVLLTFIIKGRFAGERARWGGVFLTTLLLVDLVHSDLPWIIYQNYVQKYESNPVIDFLRQKPYEHRVTLFPLERFLDFRQLPQEARPLAELYDQLQNLYHIDWAQDHFPYYNIQALPDNQRPREASDFRAYERGPLASTPFRHWELTNTRYFLAPAALQDALNQQLDGGHKRFRLVQLFPNTNGPFALFEFTGALPRAKLYSNWQISTNDQAALSLLANPTFNPSETVLVAGSLPASAASPTNVNPGTVEIVSYAPKQIALHAKAEAPSVLLLNDKYDPYWKVTVDGKPQPLLRCNYIMRGVQLSPGDHKIEFRFTPPITAWYVSLAAIFLFVVLGVILFVTRNSGNPGEPLIPPSPTKKTK